MAEGDSVPIQVVIDEYNQFIDGVMRFNYFTVSQCIQEERIVECKNCVLNLKRYKQQAIEQENEHYANIFFYMQCMSNAMVSSLTVWCKVKDGEFVKAWHSLIDAQEYVEVALKVDDSEGTQTFYKHLQSMEETLFPGWGLFNSAGIIENGVGTCSICSQDFATCDHVENTIYMGRLCRRVNIDIKEINHVALVKNPRDRRCIITDFTGEDGRCIDHFTREEVKKELKEKPEVGAISSITLTTGKMDFS